MYTYNSGRLNTQENNPQIMSDKYDEKTNKKKIKNKIQFKVSVRRKGLVPYLVTRTVVKSIPQSQHAAFRHHEHVEQLRRSAAADPVDPVGHGTILCNRFTLVVFCCSQ